MKTKVYTYELPVDGIHDRIMHTVAKLVADYDRHNLRRATIFRIFKSEEDGRFYIDRKPKAGRLYQPVKKYFTSEEKAREYIEEHFYRLSPDYYKKANDELRALIEKNKLNEKGE